MGSLNEIVKEEVAWYASGGGHGHRMYAALDDVNQVYAVNSIGDPGHEYATGIVVLARIVDDKVIIEVNNTDKSLAKSLQQAGVPAEQIILAETGQFLSEGYR